MTAGARFSSEGLPRSLVPPASHPPEAWQLNRRWNHPSGMRGFQGSAGAVVCMPACIRLLLGEGHSALPTTPADYGRLRHCFSSPHGLNLHFWQSYVALPTVSEYAPDETWRRANKYVNRNSRNVLDDVEQILHSVPANFSPNVAVVGSPVNTYSSGGVHCAVP